MKIEDYAVIGDTHTIALVSREGSIDWLCLPRFDSGACFAALLGSRDHGRWRIAPAGDVQSIERRYRDGSLVLETTFTTAEGRVRVTDCMPIRGTNPDVIRTVEGLAGSVSMHVDLVIRFDYGHIVPWLRRLDGRLSAVAGPDALVLTTPVETRGEGLATVSDFVVRAGDRVPFALTWHPSNEPVPEAVDVARATEDTDRYWRQWSARFDDRGRYREDVVRSLLTLKALTYAPTGGIVAAGTASLPEALGGARNWDYRYCWLRDATFTLYAMLHAGYRDEAIAWREWLLRAVAGDPSQLQIMYGVFGERRLDERTLDWLPGYEASKPVRIGNAAAGQLQLDVYGEVLDTFHQSRRLGISPVEESWDLQRAICEWLESSWAQPDDGLWEMRGPRRDFTHSKVMAWVAMDRAVKAVELHGLEGPVDRWRGVREAIHRDVCRRGYDAELGAFTQSYGDRRLDASLLLMPSVGFLPAKDERVVSTIAAIERSLVRDGFVMRYLTSDDANPDGLRGSEGAFLACSFWLADAYLLCGREQDARRLFERLLAVRNDVGLLSEEYDVNHRRLVGNFPQSFSHVALINTARSLGGGGGAVQSRTTT